MSEIFKITYPCLENQACWETSADVPPVPINGMYVDEDAHEYIIYSKSNDGNAIATLLYFLEDYFHVFPQQQGMNHFISSYWD